jgi:2-amino-4-hydroxy-6-hydroxymethyldihydropteridine diphosphokinase
VPSEPVAPVEPPRAAPRSPIDPPRAAIAAPVAPAPGPSRADAMIAAISGGARHGGPKPVPAPAAPAPAPNAGSLTARTNGPTCPAYLSLGSNIEPEKNLRMAIAALRARFGDVRVSPVYRTRAVGFVGPDFLNAIAVVQSDVNPFALHKWLHRLEEAQGRDRRDAAYSNRPLDVDIIYFGDLVLDGPGEFQLPRPELRHAFVLKPLADVAPDFVDPIRNTTLAQLWKIHPEHATPPERVELAL